MPPTANWVSIVGYQYEVVHTGVLRYLLDDPAVGVPLARGLTGAEVVAVGGARQESKVSGFTGTADLVADLELQDGETVALAVETKVDSDATRRQLRATAAPPHYGVLLGVGLTALKLGQPELGANLPQWRAVGPGEWLRLLDELDADTIRRPELVAYCAEVRRETHEHAAAVALAYQPQKPAPQLRDRRRSDSYLEDFAWLAEVRSRFEQPHMWWTETERSGPLMGHFPAAWHREDRVSRYVVFSCFSGGRFFMLKAGTGKGDQLGSVPDQLWQAAQPLEWRAPLRRRRPSDKSCTAAWLDFTTLAPDEAAERTQTELAALSQRLA
jgi:hypothetical protein